MHVRSAFLSMSITTALLTTVPPTSAAVTPYDGQASHSVALFSVRKPNNTAVQEFTSDDSYLERVSLYIGSVASNGKLTVSVRAVPAGATAVPANATTTIATRTLNIDPAGPDQGWLEVAMDAALVPGQKYYLFAEAESTQAVAWWGTQNSEPGSLSSWNYDAAYWKHLGGWHQETKYRLAFYVNPSDGERCGTRAEKCYGAALATGLVRNSTTTMRAVGAQYVAQSNVLIRQDGRWIYLPAGAAAPLDVPANDPGALAQIAEAKAWLDSGTVPGTGAQRDAAERALLSMRALTQPNGAVAAGPAGQWWYSWPRDSSFVAAAFAATGHDVEAYRILQFNATTQRPDGTWEARTKLDTSKVDERPWQLDANGWVPWSAYQWYQAAPQSTRDARLAEVYQMIKKAADYTAAHLDADGLPPASPDYWELASAPTPNIGTAAPLLAGLNAAAQLATKLKHTDDATRYAEAARKLSGAIAKHFAPTGYKRSPDPRYGHDSAAAFMAPPFNVAPSDLAPALDTTYAALQQGNGGLAPGDAEHDWGTAAWTPSTSFFALAWYGTGQTALADSVLGWVLAHRNTLGELPEQVTGTGGLSVTAPLAWTDSLVIMSLLAKDGTPLSTPPLPT